VWGRCATPSGKICTGISCFTYKLLAEGVVNGREPELIRAATASIRREGYKYIRTLYIIGIVSYYGWLEELALEKEVGSR
jgi:hypothetical protein